MRLGEFQEHVKPLQFVSQPKRYKQNHLQNPEEIICSYILILISLSRTRTACLSTRLKIQDMSCHLTLTLQQALSQLYANWTERQRAVTQYVPSYSISLFLGNETTTNFESKLSVFNMTN